MRKQAGTPPKAGEVTLEHDAVNEAVLVASALASPEARRSLVGRIPVDHFFEPRNASAWSAMQELERRHLELDIATLSGLAAGVDSDYLTQLRELRPQPAANLDHHVQNLFWDRQRLTAWSGPISNLVQAVRDPRTERERVRALAQQVATSFEGFGDRKHLLDPNRLVRDQMAEIRQRKAGFAIYPYGLTALDSIVDKRTQRPLLIPGAKPGEVTMITGISGSGKSTLTAHLILGQARQKRRVMVGAWETEGGPTLELVAGISLGWSRSKVVVGDLTEEELAELEVRMLAISRYVRFISNPFDRDAGSKPSNDRNLDVIHGYIADTGADVFVADLWERCLVDDNPGDEKQALYRQQKMAQETRCHVIIVQQQNLKKVEERPDKRPTRESVKGSGAYIEVSDTVIATHRPALFKAIPDNKIELIILKQRKGRWPAVIEADWEPDTGMIANGIEVPYDAMGESGSGGMEDFISEKGSMKKRRDSHGR